MAIARWFPLSIEQTIVSGGYTIVLNTDVPCHLWLFWTMNPPWTHRVAANKRGLLVPWDSYWCYTSWQIIEQDEPGDTTEHTFQWLGWETCQTKYFRFHGEISGQVSPSDSPIYSKHYIAPLVKILYEYEYTARNVFRGCGNGEIAGYIWMPAVAHSIVQIDWLLTSQAPTDSPVLCDVHLTGPTHFPTGPSLSHGEIPDSLDLGFVPKWKEFTMTPFDYSPGTEYCTIITQPGGADTGSCGTVATQDWGGGLPYWEIFFWINWQGPLWFNGPHFKHWGY